MTITLDSVQAKIARANEHAQAIKDEVVSWCGSNPYTVVKKNNTDNTRHSLVLRAPVIPPLRKWSLAAGDCVHNLRSALDHLVFAIAIHDSKQDPPPCERKLMFPIHGNAKLFKDSSNLGKISNSMRAVFESVQPYNRTHHELPPLLAVLSDLDNRDKHRLLNVAYHAVSECDIEVQFKTKEKFDIVRNTGKLEDGTEIVAFVFNQPTPHVQYDKINLDLIVAMKHDKRIPPSPLGSEYTEVTTLLRMLIEEVEEVVQSIVAKVTI